MTRALVLASAVLGAVAASAVPAHGMPHMDVAPVPTPIQRVEAALAAKNVDAAVRAAADSHRRAAASGSWERLLEAGDAYRRIQLVATLPRDLDAKAREIYRSALATARRHDSLDGVLRAAERLGEMEDRAGLEEGLRIAKALAGHDPEARDDVDAFVMRFADLLGPGGSTPPPPQDRDTHAPRVAPGDPRE